MLARYSVIELLRQAIKEEVPVVIVEGKNDVRIYEQLAEHVKKEVCVQPIGLVKWSAQSNCAEIIRLFKQERFQLAIKKNDNAKWIMGVIDGDAYQYKPPKFQIHGIVGLFKLSLYSFESYFVSSDNLKDLISRITNINKKQITNISVNYFLDKFQTIKNRLIKASVESLRIFWNDSYNPKYTYGKSWDAIYKNDNGYIDNLLSSEEVEINKFIQDNSIDGERDYKKIINGKWLINSFYKCVLDILTILDKDCQKISVDRCMYCMSKKIELDKCQWKPSAKYSNYEQLRPFLDLCLDNPEFDEIKNVINVLGNP
jgi:hypothetical protein